MEFFCEKRQDWFSYDLHGADKIKTSEPLLAEKHFRKHFRFVLGTEDEDSFMESRFGDQNGTYVVKLGEDSGGKRTVRWRLRTGDSAEPLRKHKTNQYKGSANLQSTLNTLAHSLAKPAYSNQKSGATGGDQKSKVGHVDGKIREALGEHGTWLTLMYLHKALGHVSNPKRLRHTWLGQR